MVDKTKGPIILGLGALAAGAILLFKKKPALGDEKAAIEIVILDAQGNPVPKNSPSQLTEGEAYTVVLTVTNQSVKNEIPWAATLGIGISTATDSTQLIPAQVSLESFAAGETRSFSYLMSVPLGTGGETGAISGWLEDPSGFAFASTNEPLNIIAIPIEYRATIVIG